MIKILLLLWICIAVVNLWFSPTEVVKVMTILSIIIGIGFWGIIETIEKK